MRNDWNLWQSFVAVGEHGSLSAAARATQTSQPTLSRHIATLEREVGSRLFERTVAGVELTRRGTDMMAHAKVMADAATRLSLSVSGAPETVSGTVRITASHIVATYSLPEMLTDFHIQNPDIDIEVLASDETENLLRREADIAIRMYRPTQNDVITRKIGELGIGMYAAQSYVDRKGVPVDPEDIYDHDFIGYDKSPLIIDGFREVGISVDRDFFRFRSDDQVVCWHMVLAGYGIGFNQRWIGDRLMPKLMRVDIPGTTPTMPIWLTAHKDLRMSPRIRRVYDFLVTALSERYA